MRYHQDYRISQIWPQKWIPHPQKPYRRHPYNMGLLYWGQSYQSPGWNVQDLEQAGMHHISALPILEQALPWSVDHFLVVKTLDPKWTNIFKSVWDPLLWVSTVWFSGVANPFLASDHQNSYVHPWFDWPTLAKIEVSSKLQNFTNLTAKMDSPPPKTIP